MDSSTTPAAAPPVAPPLQARILAAAPDAVVAAGFLVVWVAPFAFGPRTVSNALLTMLVEFLVIHASGFLGPMVLDGALSTRKRFLAIAGFGAFYGIFVTAFVLAFKETWPIWVFAWLLFGKFSGALARNRLRGAEAVRQQMLWGVSTALYLAGVFATTLLWVPRFGMTAAVQPQFGLNGGGVWVDEPHRVVAFGVLYFGALAWVKWRGGIGRSSQAMKGSS
jgi:hypothetical protein